MNGHSAKKTLGLDFGRFVARVTDQIFMGRPSVMLFNSFVEPYELREIPLARSRE